MGAMPGWARLLVISRPSAWLRRSSSREEHPPAHDGGAHGKLRVCRRCMRYLAMRQPIVILFFQPMPSPLPMISVPEPLRAVRLPA